MNYDLPFLRVRRNRALEETASIALTSMSCSKVCFLNNAVQGKLRNVKQMWHHSVENNKKALKQTCFQEEPEKAIRCQLSVGLLNSAIQKGYHASLFPSCLFEPGHPSLLKLEAFCKLSGHLAIRVDGMMLMVKVKSRSYNDKRPCKCTIRRFTNEKPCCDPSGEVRATWKDYFCEAAHLNHRRSHRITQSVGKGRMVWS